MQLPVQITLRGLGHSPALEKAIRERADSLDRFHGGIVSCRVVVEAAGRHQAKGRQFSVKVDLKVPGGEIAVTHEHDEDVLVAAREAFDAARRKLEDYVRVQRGDVKTHSSREGRS